MAVEIVGTQSAVLSLNGNIPYNFQQGDMVYWFVTAASSSAANGPLNLPLEPLTDVITGSSSRTYSRLYVGVFGPEQNQASFSFGISANRAFSYVILRGADPEGTLHAVGGTSAYTNNHIIPNLDMPRSGFTSISMVGWWNSATTGFPTPSAGWTELQEVVQSGTGSGRLGASINSAGPVGTTSMGGSVSFNTNVYAMVAHVAALPLPDSEPFRGWGIPAK